MPGNVLNALVCCLLLIVVVFTDSEDGRNGNHLQVLFHASAVQPATSARTPLKGVGGRPRASNANIVSLRFAAAAGASARAERFQSLSFSSVVSSSPRISISSSSPPLPSSRGSVVGNALTSPNPHVVEHAQQPPSPAAPPVFLKKIDLRSVVAGTNSQQQGEEIHRTPRERVVETLASYPDTIAHSVKAKASSWLALTEDKPSLIAGNGLFAVRDIKKGETLLEIGVEDDPENSEVTMAYGRHASMVLIQNNDGAMPDIKTLRDATYREGMQHLYAYLDESTAASNIEEVYPPNKDGVGFKFVDGTGWRPLTTIIVATRDIAKGKELLRSYGSIKWLAIYIRRLQTHYKAAKTQAGGDFPQEKNVQIQQTLWKMQALAKAQSLDVQDPSKLASDLRDFEEFTGMTMGIYTEGAHGMLDSKHGLIDSKYGPSLHPISLGDVADSDSDWSMQ